MKKVGQSKIVNLVISLVIAILLSAYVLSTKTASLTSNGSDNFSTLIPEKKATLKVPLNLQFDSDNYVAVGAPATVSVDIEGSGALISATQSRNDIQASADLRGLKPGKHTVTVALRGVNASLTSTVTPQKITVTIAKKAAVTLPIHVNYDQSKIAQGYTVSEVVSDPKRVTISGPKTNVDAVSTVVAQVALQSGIKDTVIKVVRLVAYDKDGQVVEVNFDQRSTTVTMVVTPSDSKKLSLTPALKNAGSNKYQVTFDPKSVTAYGASDILNAMSELSVPIDVSQVQGNGTLTVTLPAIAGIVRYDVKSVTAQVTQGTGDGEQSSSSSSDTSASSSSHSTN